MPLLVESSRSQASLEAKGRLSHDALIKPKVQHISVDDNGEYTFENIRDVAFGIVHYYDGESLTARASCIDGHFVLQFHTKKQVNLFVDIVAVECSISAEGPLCIDSSISVADRFEIKARSLYMVNELNLPLAIVAIESKFKTTLLGSITAKALGVYADHCCFNGDVSVPQIFSVEANNVVVGSDKAGVVFDIPGLSRVNAGYFYLYGKSKLIAKNSQISVLNVLLVDSAANLDVLNGNVQAGVIRNTGSIDFANSKVAGDHIKNFGYFHAQGSNLTFGQIDSRSFIAELNVEKSKVACKKTTIFKGQIVLSFARYESLNFLASAGKFEISNSSQVLVSKSLTISKTATFLSSKSRLQFEKAIFFGELTAIDESHLAAESVSFYTETNINRSEFSAKELAIVNGKSSLSHCTLQVDTLKLDSESKDSELFFEDCRINLKEMNEGNNVTLKRSIVVSRSKGGSTHLIRGSFNCIESVLVAEGDKIFSISGSDINLSKSSSLRTASLHTSGRAAIEMSKLHVDDLIQAGGLFFAIQAEVMVGKDVNLDGGESVFSEGSALVVGDKLNSSGKLKIDQSKLQAKKLSVHGDFVAKDKSIVNVSEELESDMCAKFEVSQSALVAGKVNLRGEIEAKDSAIKATETITYGLVSELSLMGDLQLEAAEITFRGVIKAPAKKLKQIESKAEKTCSEISKTPTLQVKASKTLTNNYMSEIKGELNISAETDHFDQLGVIDTSGRSAVKGGACYNGGSFKSSNIFLGFDKYTLNMGTLSADALTIHSNYINFLGGIYARERFVHTGLVNINILGMIAANNYSSSSLVSANLGLWAPNLAADPKYIWTLSNGLCAARTLGSAFFPHYAPAIGLAFSAVSLGMMAPGLYAQCKNASFDYKSLRLHEVMGGVCQVKNLALFGLTIASYAKGLFSGLPVSPDFSTLFDNHHCLETAGMLAGSLAGGVYDTSLLHLNMGASLEFSSTSTSLADINFGFDDSLFFHNVNTQCFNNAGEIAALNTSLLAQDAYNSGLMTGGANYHLVAKEMDNTGMIDGSGAFINVDEMKQRGVLSLSDGSGVMHHMTDTSASGTHLNDMQVKTDDANLTGHLALENHANVQVTDLHLKKGATETLDNSTIKAEHLVDESQLQYKGTSAVIAGNLNHIGHISQLDDTRSTMVLEAKNAELNGSAVIKQGVVKIDHYAKGEELIDGTGSAAKYKFDESLVFSTNEDITLKHDIQRQCDITIEAKSIDVAVDDKRGKALGFVSTEGDVTLKSDLETSSLGVKSAQDIKMNRHLAAKKRIDMEAKGGCYGLGADIDTDTLAVKAKEIQNITQGSPEARSDHGLSVGSGGHIHAKDKFFMEATDGNFENHGGEVTAGKYGQIVASGDVSNSCNEYSYQGRFDRREGYQRGVISGGDGSETDGLGLYVSANGHVRSDVSDFRSDGDNYIAGREGVELKHRSDTYVFNREHHESGRVVTKTTDVTETSTNVAFSSVSTTHGRNMIYSAKGGGTTYGSVFAAPGGTDVHTKKSIHLNAVTVIHTRQEKTRDWWGFRKNRHDEVSQTSKSTVFDGNGITRLDSEEESVYASDTSFIGGGSLEIKAKEKVILSTATNTTTAHEVNKSFVFGVGVNMQDANTRLSIAASTSDANIKTMLQTQGAGGINCGGSVKIKAGQGVELNNGVRVRAGGDIDIDAPEIKARSAALKSSSDTTTSQVGVDIGNNHCNVGVDHRDDHQEAIRQQNALIDAGGHMHLHHGDEAIDHVELDGADMVAGSVDGSITNLEVHDQQDTTSRSGSEIGASTAGKFSMHRGGGHSAITNEHSGIFVREAQGKDGRELNVDHARMEGGEVSIGGEEKFKVRELDTSPVEDVNTYNDYGVTVTPAGVGFSQAGVPVFDQAPSVEISVDHTNNHATHAPVIQGPDEHIDLGTTHGDLAHREEITNLAVLNRGTHLHAVIPVDLNAGQPLEAKKNDSQEKAFETQLDAILADKLNESDAARQRATASVPERSVLNQPATLFNDRAKSKPAEDVSKRITIQEEPSADFIQVQEGLHLAGYDYGGVGANLSMYHDLISFDADEVAHSHRHKAIVPTTSGPPSFLQTQALLYQTGYGAAAAANAELYYHLMTYVPQEVTWRQRVMQFPQFIGNASETAANWAEGTLYRYGHNNSLRELAGDVYSGLIGAGYFIDNSCQQIRTTLRAGLYEATFGYLGSQQDVNEVKAAFTEAGRDVSNVGETIAQGKLADYGYSAGYALGPMAVGFLLSGEGVFARLPGEAAAGTAGAADLDVANAVNSLDLVGRAVDSSGSEVIASSGHTEALGGLGVFAEAPKDGFVIGDVVEGVSEAGKGLCELSSNETAFYSKVKLLGSHEYSHRGRLPDNMEVTFIGSRYKSYELLDDVILHRAGTKGQPFGQSFSFEKSMSEMQTRIDKAVMPIWPGGGVSPIDTGYAIKIPKGSIVHVGDVANQGKIFMGGTRQVVVQDPWTISGVEIIEIYSLKEEVLWNEMANQLRR